MRTHILLLFIGIIFISSITLAVEKSEYDLSNIPDAENTLSKNSITHYIVNHVENNVFDITLLSGGYFTIGTTDGLSESILDDKCGITFGHPYALTSYPFIQLDDRIGKLDDYINVSSISPLHINGVLKIESTYANIFNYSFQMDPVSQGNSVVLTMTLVNIDDQSHRLGNGVVFDPGLGVKGDGVLNLSGEQLHHGIKLFDSNIPNEILLNERYSHVPGMMINIIQNQGEIGEFIAANWNRIEDSFISGEVASINENIYDLCLRMDYPDVVVPPGDSVTNSIILELVPPDFQDKLFIRWDMPGFLAIENNLLFPRYLNSCLEINNLLDYTVGNDFLQLRLPEEFGDTDIGVPVTIQPNSREYQCFDLNAEDLYKDKIVGVSAYLKDNGQVIDSLKKYVFIPEIPFSDTGLICEIDSISVHRFPRITMFYSVKVAKTGQRLFSLEKRNTFLYENNEPIQDFYMGKDTTGSAQMADIIFVLDVTGSMGNEISNVKNNVIEFSDSLTARGIDYQLGMVTFLDVIENVYDFTQDPQLFKSYVSQQYAHGGGDGPENSLDALMRATEFPFRDKSNRIIIWITDHRYHENDGVTQRNRQEVIQQLLLHDIKTHCIGNKHYQSYYSPIIEPTAGNFYDIYGNFRDILLDISRLKVISRYMISFRSIAYMEGMNEIGLEVHYAGLGGYTTIDYEVLSTISEINEPDFDVYPNPFNSSIKIQLKNSDYMTGNIKLYNILGQQVSKLPIKPESNPGALQYTIDRGLSAGTYFLQVNLYNEKGDLKYNQIKKILYLK